MNKIGNFFIKIGQGIKKGFFGLINWVKNTAWIQPLLIVGLIFGVILSIKPVTSWVGGILNPDATYAFLKRHDSTLDDDGMPIEMTSTLGTKIIVYYTESSISSQIKDLEKLDSLDVTYYCINVELNENEDVSKIGKILADNGRSQEYSAISIDNNENYSDTFANAAITDDELLDENFVFQKTPLYVRYDVVENEGKNEAILRGIMFDIDSDVEKTLERFFIGTTDDWKMSLDNYKKKDN